MNDLPSKPNLELLLYFVLKRSIQIENGFDTRLSAVENTVLDPLSVNVSVNNGQLLISRIEGEEENNG